MCIYNLNFNIKDNPLFFDKIFYQKIKDCLERNQDKLIILEETPNIRYFVICFDIEITSKQILLGLHFHNCGDYVGFYYKFEIFAIHLINLKVLVLKILNILNQAYLLNDARELVVGSEISDVFGVGSSALLFKPLFLTYNGSKFDLRILWLILNDNKLEPNDLWLFSQDLINSSSFFGRSNDYNFKKKHWKFSKNIFNSTNDFENIAHIDVIDLLGKISDSDPIKIKNLDTQKIKLFLTPNFLLNKLGRLVLPKFFDEITLELGGFDREIPDHYLECWFEYNKNDLLYTILAFYFYSGVQFFKSRIIFLKTQKLAEGVKNSDVFSTNNANLGKLIEWPKGAFELENKELETKIQLTDLIILHNFSGDYFNFYLQKYKNFNYISGSYTPPKKNENPEVINPTFQIKGFELNYSRGGIHSFHSGSSVFWEEGFRVGGDFTKGQFVALDVDVQGYYVALILLLLENYKKIETAKKIREMNNQRIIQKKSNPTLSGILKIINLSCTGNLNSKYSQVFRNPLLYFSMTTNGQLFLCKLLTDTQNLWEFGLLANTDGFAVLVQQENIAKMLEALDLFQEETNLVLDTRDFYSKGVISDVNNYILVPTDRNLPVKAKGYVTDSSLLQVGAYKFLSERLDFSLFKNTPINENLLFGEIIGVLWEFLQDLKGKENSGSEFIFSYSTSFTDNEKKLRLKERVFYFFSKKPDSYSGIACADKVSKTEFPCKDLKSMLASYPTDKIANVYKEIWDQIDLISYLIKLFDSVVIDFFQLHNKPVKFQETWFLSPEIYSYVKGKNLIFVGELLATAGFYVFPKKSNKKTFPGYKSPKKGDFKGAFEYFEYSIKHNLDSWLRGVCVATHLNLSFPLSVIDFDDMENFALSCNQNLLQFLTALKKKNLIIFGSPNINGIRNFKGIVEFKNFKDISEVRFFINENKCCFSVETEASLYGAIYPYVNLDFGLNSINDIPFVDKKLLNSFSSPQTEGKSLEFHSQLLDFFGVMGADFQDKILKNWVLKESKSDLMQKIKSKKNLKDWDLDESIKEMYLEKINGLKKKKNNPNPNFNLKIPLFSEYENSAPKKELLNFSSSLSIKIDNSMLDLFNKKKITDPTQKTKNEELIPMDRAFWEGVNLGEYGGNQNYQKDIPQPKLSKASLLQGNLPIEERVIDKDFLESFNASLLYINHLYGYNFRVREESLKQQTADKETGLFVLSGKSELIANSKCIFHPESSDNRVVSLIVTANQVKINCYHETCKELKRHSEVLEAFVNYWFSVLLMKTSSPFLKLESSNIYEILYSEIFPKEDYPMD